MRQLLLIHFFFCITCTVWAQASPWETVAPAGSFVYTDIRSAAQEAGSAYRMILEGPQIVRDKKQMGKLQSLSSLMALKLVNNDLERLPSSVLNLSALVYLNSTGNKLTGLSDSMGMLGNLKYLDLQGTAFDTLPSGVYGIPRLQSFTLASNTDTLTITSDIRFWSKNLTELRFYSCVLDTLPKEFSKLDKVEKMVMYRCRMDSIPSVMYPMEHVKELWLDSNLLTEVPRMICTMKGLTYLSLRGNRITKVSSSICFLTSLEVLDLRGNPLDPYDVKVLQALLPKCRILF